MQATTIGSDSAVQRFPTQQILNTGDRVAGFAALDGGFALASYLVTATFDSFFPVSGNIAINGGTLTLNKDLYLENASTFMPTGTISGVGHKLEFSSINMLPFTIPSCNITFIASVMPSAQTIETVDWSFDSQFMLAGTNATILSTVLFVYGFNGTTITARGTGSGSLLNLSSINSVAWHPSQYVFAVAQNNALLVASQVLTFSYVPATNTISALSSASTLSQNATAITWNPTGLLLAAGTSGATLQTPEVVVYTVNSAGSITALNATYNLMQPGTGTRFVQNNAISWSPSGNLIAVGTNTTTVGFEILILLWSAGLLVADTVTTIGNTCTAVAWSPTISGLLAAGFNTTSGTQVQLFQHHTGGLTAIPSAIINNLNAAVGTLQWNPSGTCLLVGTAPLAGTDQFNVYSYNSTQSTLTLTGASGTVTANGVQSASWAPNGIYVAEADNTNVLSAYDTTSYTTTNTCSTFTNVNWTLATDLTIQSLCLKLSGNTLVNGSGNILTLGTGASLVIDKGASVLFENLVIRGVSTGQFLCLDNAGTMSFQNTQLVLDGDYTFTNGRFDILNQLMISGTGHSFIYTSTQPSTIRNNATLLIDDGVTFSYQPSNGTRTALQFFDNTGQLFLSNAILATAAGILLEKGRLVIDGSSFLINQGGNPATSIAFGDGASSSNNCVIRCLPAANVSMASGYFLYNNL